MPRPPDRPEPGDGPPTRPKRRRILESARDVFTEQGFDAARMDEVARRARVSKGTVYNHFESKESLLLECVLDGMEETRESIDALVRDHSLPDHALALALRTLAEQVLPRVVGGTQSLSYQVWSLVARDTGARDRLFSHYRRIYAEREDRLRNGLEAGARAGVFRRDLAADDIALVLLAIFDGLVYRAMFDPERIEPQTVVNTLLRLLEGGLRRSGPALDADPATDDAADEATRAAGGVARA